MLASGKGDLKCHITANPFKVDLVSEEEVVMSINSLGQLYFEQLQIPPTAPELTAVEQRQLY